MTKSCCWLHPHQTYSALLSRKATECAGSLVQQGASAEMFGERRRAPAEPGALLLEPGVSLGFILGLFYFFFLKVKLPGQLQQSLWKDRERCVTTGMGFVCKVRGCQKVLFIKEKKKEKNLPGPKLLLSLLWLQPSRADFSGRQFHCLISVQSHPLLRAQIPSRAGAVPQSRAALGYF